MDAVILLNKPAGITSFDAVRRCRRIFHEKKAGHTGTLDPQATGLMIILLGKYTKLLPYCAAQFKQYKATFSFGRSTDTEDAWGTVTEEREPRFHTKEELDQAAVSLTGNIMQVPPMYSAIKKDGRKLYEYARKGIEVEREARPAVISRLEVSRIADNDFAMEATVSSGTYIRTLITDYAASLGELAIMTSLERTAIDHISLDQAADFEQLENGMGIVRALDVIDQAYERVPLVQEKKVRNGMAVSLEGYSKKILFTDNDEPCAIYVKENDGLYHCQRGLW